MIPALLRTLIPTLALVLTTAIVSLTLTHTLHPGEPRASGPVGRHIRVCPWCLETGESQLTCPWVLRGMKDQSDKERYKRSRW